MGDAGGGGERSALGGPGTQTHDSNMDPPAGAALPPDAPKRKRDSAEEALLPVAAEDREPKREKTATADWVCKNCCHRQDAGSSPQTPQQCSACSEPSGGETGVGAVPPVFRVALAFDEKMLLGSSAACFERADRISHARELLESQGLLADALLLESQPAGPEELNLAHDAQYVADEGQARASAPLAQADGPAAAPVGTESLDPRVAVGCAVAAVAAVAAGTATAALALVRPPGHRAGREVSFPPRSDGGSSAGAAGLSCYNNVAGDLPPAH